MRLSIVDEEPEQYDKWAERRASRQEQRHAFANLEAAILRIFTSLKWWAAILMMLCEVVEILSPIRRAWASWNSS